MANTSEWPNVARIAWLSGGLVAVNNPGTAVSVAAGMGGLVIEKLQLLMYHELLPALTEQGLRVLGVSFVETSDEASGITPAQFFALFPDGTWQARSLRQKWREISFHAGQRDSMRLADTAARLASGIASGQTRLQHLCHAYAVQLRSQVRDLPAKSHVRFKDGNSSTVYLAIHAMFWELAVLRDVLAEYASRFVFDVEKVSTMRGLVSHLRKVKSSLPLADELIEASDHGAKGWISIFSSYRNLFTHSAPMQQAAGSAFVIQDIRKLRSGHPAPAIYCPLPADAAYLARRRSEGMLFQTFNDFLDATQNAQADRNSEPDALDYLATSFDRLIDLASQLLASSPIQAAAIQLADQDIIGDISVKST